MQNSHNEIIVCKWREKIVLDIKCISAKFKLFEVSWFSIILRDAILDNDFEEFKLNVNDLDSIHCSGTALSLAASRGRVNVVRLLLEYGADPHLSNTAGWTALHSAVGQKNTNIAELLLKLGVNPNLVADYFYSSKYIEFMKLMLQICIHMMVKRGKEKTNLS